MPRPNFLVSPSKKGDRDQEKRRKDMKRSISSPIDNGAEHLPEGNYLREAYNRSITPSSSIPNAVPLGEVSATRPPARPDLSRLTTAPAAISGGAAAQASTSRTDLSSQATRSMPGPSAKQTPSRPHRPPSQRMHTGLDQDFTANVSDEISRGLAGMERTIPPAWARGLAGPVSPPSTWLVPSTSSSNYETEKRSSSSVADARQAGVLMTALHREKLAQYEREAAERRATRSRTVQNANEERERYRPAISVISERTSEGDTDTGVPARPGSADTHFTDLDVPGSSAVPPGGIRYPTIPAAATPALSSAYLSLSRSVPVPGSSTALVPGASTPLSSNLVPVSSSGNESKGRKRSEKDLVLPEERLGAWKDANPGGWRPGMPVRRYEDRQREEAEKKKRGKR